MFICDRPKKALFYLLDSSPNAVGGYAPKNHIRDANILFLADFHDNDHTLAQYHVGPPCPAHPWHNPQLRRFAVLFRLEAPRYAVPVPAQSPRLSLSLSPPSPTPVPVPAQPHACPSPCPSKPADFFLWEPCVSPVSNQQWPRITVTQVLTMLCESFVESLTILLPFYPTGTMERVVCVYHHQQNRCFPHNVLRPVRHIYF